MTPANKYYLQQHKESPLDQLVEDTGLPAEEIQAYIATLPKDKMRHVREAVIMTPQQSQMPAPKSEGIPARTTQHQFKPMGDR